MLWLFLACAEAPLPVCEVVLQTVEAETPGDSPSGFEYCAGEDGRGVFNRVSSESCGDGGFCSSDADCDADEACLCSAGVETAAGWEGLTVVSQCVSATCASPDDCGGLACSLTFDVCGSAQGLFCRTTDDACATDADCGESGFCFYNGSNWSCEAMADCG